MDSMVKSMTGYGRGITSENGCEMSVEIKSVNHRYLDLSVRLPRNLSFLEDEIRKTVQGHVARGRVEIYVTYQNNADQSKEITVDYPLLDAYLRAYRLIAERTDMKDDITLSFLSNIPDVLIVSQKEEDSELLKEMAVKAVKQALDELLNMRIMEGKKLLEDVLARVEYIGAMVDKIEERAPLVVQEYREKLRSRISELLQGSEMDENRFNMEVAFFADRSNITEEIVRLRSHIDQLKRSFDLSQPIGRKLDFIIQEMNREINTIGSKASDLDIINTVVDVKSEIEKIREQVQNFE